MELREDSNAANGTTLPLPFRMEYRNTWALKLCPLASRP